MAIEKFLRIGLLAAAVIGLGAVASAQNSTLNHVTPTGPGLQRGDLINNIIDRLNDGSFNEITAAQTPFVILGLPAAQGGSVQLKGGASSTTGNAGGAALVTGGTPGATGVGGAATIAGAAGGSTSGTGGAATLTGGVGTASNAVGGVATVTAGAAQGTGTGATAGVVGGASGAGATGNGGVSRVVGGAALSTDGTGGAAQLTGGVGKGTGTGGAAVVTGGAAPGTGTGGAVTLTGGAATAGVGGAVTITAGTSAGGTNNGAVINLVPSAAVSTGVPGTVKVNGNDAIMCTTYAPTGTPAATDVVIHIANRAQILVSAYAVWTVAAGGTSTLQLTKDTGTDAPGAGTDLLQSTGFNLNGTANTSNAGTLITTVASLTFAAGNRLALDFANTIQATAGVVVTACFAPL